MVRPLMKPDYATTRHPHRHRINPRSQPSIFREAEDQAYCGVQLHKHLVRKSIDAGGAASARRAEHSDVGLFGTHAKEEGSHQPNSNIYHTYTLH